MTADTGFRREVTPYPDSDAGVKIRGPVRMPVGRPPEPAAEPAPRRRRRSPGDPGCLHCRESRRGYCTDHADYHAEVDPLAGLPGTRPGAVAPEDRYNWTEVRR